MITETLRASITTESTGKFTLLISSKLPLATTILPDTPAFGVIGMAAKYQVVAVFSVEGPGTVQQRTIG